MKRLITLLSVFLLINVFAFSNFFTSRFFEIKAGTDLSLSNNVMSLNDVLKKDLVIDLRKIAEDCPASGFNVVASMQPSVEMNLNIKILSIGFSSGVEMYEKVEIGKSIFDFLGYGNSIGQTVIADIRNNTETFAYTQADVGFNLGKFRLHVKPALFMPVLVINNSGGTATAVNTADGRFRVSALMNMEVYTPLELVMKDGKIQLNTESLQNSIFSGYGFDLGASLRLPLFGFNVEGEARVPLVPGRISRKYVVNGEFAYESSVLELGRNNNFVKRDPSVGNAVETDFTINRPLKAAVYIDKSFIGNFLNLRAGGGVGIRRPLSETQFLYPEYYLGLTVNIFDILKATLSTQYRDQVFIHQLGTTINVRIIQLDLGASLRSSEIKKSFEFSGFGAYAYVSVGF